MTFAEEIVRAVLPIGVDGSRDGEVRVSALMAVYRKDGTIEPVGGEWSIPTGWLFGIFPGGRFRVVCDPAVSPGRFVIREFPQSDGRADRIV